MTRRRMVNLLLLAGGVGLFVYLVQSSGVTLQMLRDFGWSSFLAVVAAFGLVVLFDTVAWYHAIRHVVRPPFLPLLGLRVSGDALMNALPGGIVLGETHKAVMLRRYCGISLTDNAASLLLVKFGLGLSQALFVLIGLGLCYPLLRSRSRELFGFAGAHDVSLALTIGMALLMLVPLVLMLRGNSLASAAAALAKLPSERLRGWLARCAPGISRLDDACASALRDGRGRVLQVFAYVLLGWLASSLESYLLLTFLGLDASLRTAYVIESVGSMFRLVFFIVPSGIGGQDVSFVALFRLYGLPKPAAGVFVLIKRFKEVLWIGAGLLLIPLLKRGGAATHPTAQPAPAPTREM